MGLDKEDLAVTFGFATFVGGLFVGGFLWGVLGFFVGVPLGLIVYLAMREML